MKKWLLASLFLSFMCVHAWGDTDPTRIVTEGTCQKLTMCAAQTATGVCTVLPASGDERVLRPFGRWSRFTFFGNESVDTPWSCDVFGNNTGYDLESGDGVQLNTASITNANESITVYNGDFGFIWINCSVIETSVTMTVNACPSNR